MSSLATLHVGEITNMTFECREQVAEWQASDGLSQHVLIHGEYLIQVSCGKVKIWSIKTYELVKSKRIFDRVATGFVLVNGTVACVGRDAATETDLCGLNPGFKIWRLDLTEGKNVKQEMNPNNELVNGADVIQVGSLVRRSTGLMALDHDRLAVCVLRKVWYLEIWRV